MANVKPVGLHAVDGTFRKDRHAARANAEPRVEGAPKPPVRMTGRAKKVWKECVDTGHWLTFADSKALYAYVMLYLQIEEAEGRVIPAIYAQFASLGSRLGFDPKGRASLGAGLAKQQDAKKADGPDRFFNKR